MSSSVRVGVAAGGHGQSQAGGVQAVRSPKYALNTTQAGQGAKRKGQASQRPTKTPLT